jgi:uncharacterized protein YgiM (DUF1202 family)
MANGNSLVKAAFLSTVITLGSVNNIFANVAVVKEDNAAVNEEASLDSDIVSNLNKGDSVDLLQIDGDFYEIALEGVENAFILESLVNVIEAEALVIGDHVEIYKQADEESEVMGEASYGDTIVVNGLDGDFYRVKYNDLDCYVKSEYIMGDMIYSVQKIDSEENSGADKTKFVTLVAKSGGVNLRDGADTDSDVIYVMERNSVFDVVDDSDPEWVKVSYGDGEYFIHRDFVLVQTGVKPDREPEVISKPQEEFVAGVNASKADEIIAYSKRFLGTPYVWGGTNLSRGVDCSGFTYSVMRDNGIYLNRTSREQIYNGSRVSKSDLQKGDLVFFGNGGGGSIQHVGMFIGDGQFIHAASGSGRRVMISSLSESYYVRNYIGACRVI